MAGRVCWHGSCAAWGEAAVLLLGAPGSGKSDLLLRLIDRGFRLVADDQVIIEAGLATAPASLAGLIEVRGLGLLRMPHVEPVRLVLAVALDDAAADDAAAGGASPQKRLPEPRCHPQLGLPLLRLDAFASSAPFRIEIAMDCLAGRRALMVGALANETMRSCPGTRAEDRA